MDRCTKLAWLALVVVAGCQCKGEDAEPSVETEQEEPAVEGDEARSAEELREAAVDGWIFGYPLVLMDVTREVSTQAESAGSLRAPLNQLARTRTFPDASFHDVVRPNVDTLYASAWLDLREQPVVVTVPDMGDRYYILQLLDAWTEVFTVLGTRTETEPGAYALTGPDFEGQLPEGVREVEAPTDMVWMIGRIQTNGTSDYERVHALQDQLAVAPLSEWSPDQPPTPVADSEGDEDSEGSEGSQEPSPEQRVREMSAGDFFGRLATLMAENPPTEADAPMVRSLQSLGVEPGKPFDVDSVDDDVEEALEAAPEQGIAKLQEAASSLDDPVNGWSLPHSGMGRYGTDYLQRAAVALFGLGANLPEDAIYGSTEVDGEGEHLSGENRYRMHFDAGQEPPVDAFWSVTVYGPDGYLTDNPIDRYALGDRDELTRNPDGSLELHLQHEEPEGDSANWLPVPEGEFNLILRLYSPKPAVSDGSWEPPPVQREP